MELVRCPNCGALSAARQKMCPQCETRLDGVSAAAAVPAAVAFSPVCKFCKCATVFPPVGVKLAQENIWCTLLNAAKLGDGGVGDCFAPSFAWRREERLD
jgi:NMD protein affecting ribosome stability and mRNA decay